MAVLAIYSKHVAKKLSIRIVYMYKINVLIVKVLRGVFASQKGLFPSQSTFATGANTAPFQPQRNALLCYRNLEEEEPTSERDRRYMGTLN